MVIKRIQHLNDLKDSALLYNKNPPKFMTIIILVIFIALIITVVIADNKQKSESIQSIGIVQSESKQYVMSPFGGEIDEICVEEGVAVEKGDILIIIGATDEKAQLELYKNLSNYYFDILKGYYKMYDAVDNYNINNDAGADLYNKNPFDANSEKIMYISYQNFLRQMAEVTDDDNHSLMENRQLYLDQSLMSCNQMIMQYEPTYKQTLYQKEYYQAIIDKHTITAETDGTVHFETTLGTRMVVSVGTVLFSISNMAEDNSALIKLQIPAAYRPHISIGYKTQIEVAGYPSEAYGKLNGRITEISSDSNVDSNGNVWFTAYVIVDDTIMIGRAGAVKVVNGMMVSATIIYENSTWLEWILKGLGL
ncbi:hypothetical protein Mpt1_c11700 [Candidatus Methanoplasma termitum]|uniref:AprE-like beta-barrel domain-containing protein n=1 Tax=Candidatus Methanoplasma termitum TaxID=1577791 RepID=A0A0A7LFI0_9ARCH|nr:HlyD family efflux transporter periplasmic adaptor subunit [Candidatus Methanoplasma termitum]AIZ57032.1 hypothetical protein Mpt1_c11700 [Candidatus Methanoplasma termitum]